ncbi:unnamed protein product [Hymenolepis diminuta]|uniref:Abhydrolase_2 domain-containing protein n=1 Tax=Hymenolepis diminuta TaxID=6216 RepID=A0A158QDK5_HYMDI|nr:unnamed protein product [Hymenolepis diminuta]
MFISFLERDYATFLSLPPMKTLLTRCQWIVIILPGQEEGADDMEKSKTLANKGDKPKYAQRALMPKFSDMAADVLEILKQLHILIYISVFDRLSRVVLFGEGLGANLLARVACLDEEIVLGAVLIHCCGVFLGPLASVKDKMQRWRAHNLPTEPYTERQIIDHRFKSMNSENHSLNLKDAEAEFKECLHTKLNLNNIKKLSIVYEQRVSMTEQISRLSCSVLFMAGKQSANLGRHRLLVEAVKKIHAHDQVSIESIEYDDTVSPLVEKPEKVAESLRYFLQGLGLVSCLSGSTTNAGYKIRGIVPMPSLPDDGVELANSLNDNCTMSDQSCPRRYSPPPMQQQKRVGPPFVRRQMSMAELDMPRGPAAFSSIKPSSS